MVTVTRQQRNTVLQFLRSGYESRQMKPATAGRPNRRGLLLAIGRKSGTAAKEG
jgi:hypothetical protein